MPMILALALGTSTRLRLREFVPVCFQFCQTSQHQCEFAARSLRLVSVGRKGAGVDAPLFNAQLGAGNDSIQLLSSLVDMSVPPISLASKTFRRARGVAAGGDDKRRRDVECPPDAAREELVCHLSRQSLSG